MKHKFTFGLVFVMLALALVSVTGVQAGRQQSFYLDWRQVVPSGSGDPNMFGSGTVDVNPGQGRLCYTLRVIIYPYDWPPTGATIHRAPAGQNGPLAVDLHPDFGPLGQPETSGCLAISSSLAHDIQRNPASYYILVTDNTHPDGAARAQFSK